MPFACISRTLAFLPLILSIGNLKAQSFANGDFESMIGCPPFFGPDEQIGHVMENWFAVQGTPDGYHEDCPAFHPDSTPGLPSPFLGSGYAGLWGPSEVIGHTLGTPLLLGKTYCINFTGQVLDLSGVGQQAGDPCLSLCVYGSMIDPPPVTPLSLPIPVEMMPGTFLLGCSNPLPVGNWGGEQISFATDAAYEHLFLTSLQDPSCNSLPYLCLDEITLAECLVTSMDEIAFADLGTALQAYRSDADIHEMRIFDLDGRLIGAIDLATGDQIRDLRPGLYLLQGLGHKGRIISTGKVVVADRP